MLYTDTNGYVGQRNTPQGELADVLAEVSDSLNELADLVSDFRALVSTRSENVRDAFAPLTSAGRWDVTHDVIRTALASLTNAYINAQAN